MSLKDLFERYGRVCFDCTKRSHPVTYAEPVCQDLQAEHYAARCKAVTTCSRHVAEARTQHHG